MHAGKISEHMFIARALGEGFVISIPSAENIPYDVIIDSNKKLMKVQVKSSARPNKISRLRGPVYKVTCSKSISKNAYAEDDAHFVAVHLQDIDVWYLLPIRKVLDKTSLLLYPDAPIKRDPLRRYKNNWSRLKRK